MTAGGRLAPAAPFGGPVTFIRPAGCWGALEVVELWRYRELLYFLVWRDVKVRYKQTLLGATWALLQPFVTMVIFTAIFARLAGMPSDGGPIRCSPFARCCPGSCYPAQ